MKTELAGPDERVERRPPVLPWLVVLFVGAGAIGAWFLIAPALGSGPYYRQVLYRSSYGYNRQILPLFVPYGLALWAWWRGSRIAVRWLLGGAVLLHLLVLFAPPPQSQDLFQYLFYGRMQAAYHANPYAIQPVRYWLDRWYGMIQWPTQTSVYGPAWTLLAFGVARAAGSNLSMAVVLMKLAILAMDLGVIACILALSRDRRDPDGAAGWGLLVYAWNPLILIAVPLGGLVDVGVAAALLAGLLARRRGRTWLATVLFTAAALVKIYAGIGLLLHLVLVARQRSRREAGWNAAFGAGMAAVSFAPYWTGWQTFHGMVRIADRSNKSFTGMIQRLLVPVVEFFANVDALNVAAAIVRWVVLPLLVLAVLWAVRRARSEVTLAHGALVVLALYTLLTPWSLYWYLVAPIAIAAVLPRNRLTVPLLVFSGTSLFTAAFWPWLLGQVTQASLRYIPPIAVYLWEGHRERRRRALGTDPGPVAPFPLNLEEDAGRSITLV